MNFNRLRPPYARLNAAPAASSGDSPDAERRDSFEMVPLHDGSADDGDLGVSSVASLGPMEISRTPPSLGGLSTVALIPMPMTESPPRRPASPSFWAQMSGSQRFALVTVTAVAAATVVGASLGVYFDGQVPAASFPLVGVYNEVFGCADAASCTSSPLPDTAAGLRTLLRDHAYPLGAALPWPDLQANRSSCGPDLNGAGEPDPCAMFGIMSARRGEPLHHNRWSVEYSRAGATLDVHGRCDRGGADVLLALRDEAGAALLAQPLPAGDPDGPLGLTVTLADKKTTAPCDLHYVFSVNGRAVAGDRATVVMPKGQTSPIVAVDAGGKAYDALILRNVG
jgi:hypothetical protein